MSRFFPLALLALVAALLAGPAVSAAGPSGGEFLALSDIHFDALADPALVDQLAAAPAGSWPALFARSPAMAPSRFGRDTNWPLFRSALRQMRATLPRPEFLLIPGDFLAHGYRERFGRAAAQPTEAAYRAFVVKSVQVVAEQLQAAFPDPPMLPVLGNNDADCGDYQLQPNGPFLRDTLPIVRALLRGGFGPGFDAGWTANGSYNVAHPTLPGVRVVFANTVFFSRDYRNHCGSGGDPAAQTLAWLRAQLEHARGEGRKVWLIYHIPPGIDVFATLEKHGCADAVPMWRQADAVRFAALIHEFADTIAVSFAGHTHRDEFRLTGAAGRRDGFVLIVPALSPVFGQNPAFQVFDYDATGILDTATHYVANLETATDGARLEWRTEPTFSAEWQLPRLDLNTLQALDERLGIDRAAGRTWLLRYAVSRAGLWPLPTADGLVPDDIFRGYYCAIGSDSEAAYQACRCTPR